MKGDGAAASVPTCFISNHQGFLGSIKKFIKDFVVTEIDMSGQKVTSSAAPPAAAAHGASRHDNNNLHDVHDVQLQQDGGDLSAEFREDGTFPSPESFDLSLILGQAVSEQLELFVVGLRDDKEEQEPAGSKELSLGSFTDKYQRANVHRAVRHRFPFLMTVTIQPEIRVREDPDYRALAQLVTEGEAEDFFRFIDAKVRDSSYSFHPDEDKEHRAAVHHFLNRRFGKLVETKSFSHQERTAISVRLRERGRPRKRSADERREEEVYTAFTLCKENLETLEAISYMAAALGVLPSDFTYAGIKDKRAVTYQAMVVKKVSPQRLMEKTGEFEKRGMRLSQVRPVSEPLRLGRLRGNHFDLVVRNLRPHGAADTRSSTADTRVQLAALVEEAVENVKARGFVNYFGPQRFGSGQSVQSDQVGLALLKEDLVSAVRLFFSPEDGDDVPSQAKRHFLQTDNAKEALALMPLSKARERLMLRAMNRYGTGRDGCAQAWLSLPHSSRVFYPHAYCSRVWNEAVAHRLATLGHRARRGDLVWRQGGRSSAEEGGEGSTAQIHVVTDQEEQDGSFTLGQVLLPMPGNTVRYPENAMGSWYQERLGRDGLADCRFRVSGLKLNVPGCYRPLLASLCNLRYQLHTSVSGEGGETPGGGGGGGRRSDGLPKQESDLLTLTLNFDLDSSCYATICLREMMKCDP